MWGEMNKVSIRFLVFLFVLSAVVISCSSASPSTFADPTGTPTEPQATITPAMTITATPVPRMYAKSVSAGLSRSCAVTLEGGVYCWGLSALQKPDDMGQISLVPVYITGFEGIEISSISCADTFACALTSSGGVKCWGGNFYGTLGDDRASGIVSNFPVDAKGLSSGVVKVATGMSHACALLATGKVMCWGDCTSGQCGNSSYLHSYAPSEVVGLSGAVDLDVGDEFSCVVTENGGLKCWGFLDDGSILGSGVPGHANSYWEPIDVKGMSSGARAVTIGHRFSCALLEDGSVKCWGYNYSRILGDGTEIDSSIPVDVIGLDLPVVTISANGTSVCALMVDGTLKCWGQNFSKHQSDESVFLTPTLITGFEKKVLSVSVGEDHGCVILEGHSVVCWGYNYYGQIGGGKDEIKSPPTYVVCPTCKQT